MTLAASIVIGFALEVLIGDPEGWPHPVRGVGWITVRLETFLRSLGLNLRVAGVLLVVLITFPAGLITWFAGLCFYDLHPLVGAIFDGVVLYLALGIRQLLGEAGGVHRHLINGDLVAARTNLARLVSRKTETLNEEGIVRAVIETTSENFSDGFIAPLVFFLVGGPVGAVVYKCVSTLDSMVGYRSERYIKFGWASARLDDLLNLIPSRLAALLIIVSAAISGGSTSRAFAIWRRDGKKHASPNSAQCEAAVAGALGVQLGGAVEYPDGAVMRGAIGEAKRRLTVGTIDECRRLLACVSVLAFALAFLASVFRTG